MLQAQLPSRPVIIGLVLLYVVSLLVNLGLVPLYLEEPRRAFITLEMLIRNDWIVPTELGDPYFKKPPLFNWVMIPFYRLFGFTEWAPRMITVLSLLGMGLLNWWVVRRYATRELAFWSTALFLVGGDIYFSFSTIGEIDVFYSLVTYASIIVVFHFDRSGRPWPLFMSVYALSAVGFLTKGLPSILFPLITLAAWFGWQRRWKSLFSLPHVAGLLVFTLLVGAFFFAYSQRASLDGYWRDLWSQSSERTVVRTGVRPVFSHFVGFTIETALNILPASLLLPFFLRRGIMGEMKREPFLWFCTLAIVANAVVYWLSPGSRSRYIYMLFPLMAILLVHAWITSAPGHAGHRWLKWIIALVLIAVGTVGLVPPFLVLPEQIGPERQLHLPFGLLFLALGALSLSGRVHRITVLLGAFIAARVAFDLIVLPVRAREGSPPQEKADALRIAAIAGDRPLHLYEINGEGAVSFTTVFYLERERWKVLDKTKPGNENGTDLYIARSVQLSPSGLPPSLEGRAVEKHYTWRWKENEYALVRFLDRPSP